MSNADLSREIAQLVSRAVAGEAIDPRAAGESLARRFPHLILSAELIGKAVARAASMVGVPLSGSEAVVSPPAYRAADVAFWFREPSAAIPASKLPGPTRGWFAPPKAGAARGLGPEQMLLTSDGQGMQAS